MSVSQYVDRRDLTFLLFEVGDAESLSEEYGRADIEAMIDEVWRLAEAAFEGLADLMDLHPPELVDGRIVNPPELGKALHAYVDMGVPSAHFPSEYGGMDMPLSIAMAVRVPVEATGGSALGYMLLTGAAASMLAAVGSEEQKARWLEPLVSMRWFGTMMLSETEAGSSLGDLTCTARLQDDGTYHLTGSKMWISGADHDMTDNIVHMVLAKIADEDGTVAGSQGISLFLVPARLLDDDGTPGRRNGITISGLNHKMGQRAIVNTVPVLGEDEPCVGYLLGRPGKGLAAMFHMMNEARIGIGYAAALSGLAGYRYSLDYARQRRQGRPVDDPDPTKEPVSIISHADVKRMLLEQKAIAEGAMALCLYAGEVVDRIDRVRDDEERDRLERLLAVLTPMVKTWPSTWCLRANEAAIQVLGGYGYTRDFPVERIYRDNRLNPIHEGTTGIQGLDLVGRKLLRDGGQGFEILLAEIESTIDDAEGVLSEEAEALTDAVHLLRDAARALLGEAAGGRVADAMANSTVFLDMCGTVVVGWMWLRMGLAATRHPDAADDPFLRGKLRACRYFHRWELPRVALQGEIVRSVDLTPAQMANDEF